jgi:hypothetical protein
METETQQTLFLEDSSDEKHSMLDSALEPPTRATRDRAVRVAVERRDWDVLAELSSQPGGFQEARSVAWYASLPSLAISTHSHSSKAILIAC